MRADRHYSYYEDAVGRVMLVFLRLFESQRANHAHGGGV